MNELLGTKWHRKALGRLVRDQMPDQKAALFERGWTLLGLGWAFSRAQGAAGGHSSCQ